jgi:hypothetical protein
MGAVSNQLGTRIYLEAKALATTSSFLAKAQRRSPRRGEHPYLATPLRLLCAFARNLLCLKQPYIFSTVIYCLLWRDWAFLV